MTQFFLEEDEDVAVLTHEGKFGGIWARSYEEVVSHADEIHCVMAKIVKNTDYQNGYWVWVFKDKYSAIEGQKL